MAEQNNQSMDSAHPLYKPWIAAVTAGDCLELAQEFLGSGDQCKFDLGFVSEQMIVAAEAHIRKAISEMETL